MSQLRAPVARADHREADPREGGLPGLSTRRAGERQIPLTSDDRDFDGAAGAGAPREPGGSWDGAGTRPPASAGATASGEPAGTSAGTSLRLRAGLSRLAVLPAVSVALCGSCAVLVTFGTGAAQGDAAMWTLLGAMPAAALAAALAAASAARRTARSITGRAAELRGVVARDRAELGALLERLTNGEEPAPPRAVPPAAPGADELALLAEELGHTHASAVSAVLRAARLSAGARDAAADAATAPRAAADDGSGSGNDHTVEVFVNLARRLQSLVHRELQILDALENEVEDPDLLQGLFDVDLLATRIRRHAESLAVLGGAVSRRQWSRPVAMTEVLRSSTAEVEQYARVKLVPPVDGTLRGHAVADVVHLLAELIENATVFSAPATQVLLRAQHVSAGLAVEVEDRGLGMPPAARDGMNALLADPGRVDLGSLLKDGRIGLFVVASLARRHGIAVRLQGNVHGGTRAVILVPHALLGADEPQPSHEFPEPQKSQGPRIALPAQIRRTLPRQTPAGHRPGPAAAAPPLPVRGRSPAHAQ
ncbi:sensor histidine kinase KdpD, partial [Streptomyces sp. GC420]|uniref:sensor histidine kinase n=1 Tax=Streptomyces sp. GC420 TaxID=2697568 RepID=UPI001414F59C